MLLGYFIPLHIPSNIEPLDALCAATSIFTFLVNYVLTVNVICDTKYIIFLKEPD